jgi:hypothetical protein
MIDTTIEIRSSDRQWLIFALQALLAKIEDDVMDKPRGGISAHNYDVFYNIEKVKEIA